VDFIGSGEKQYNLHTPTLLRNRPAEASPTFSDL